MMQALCPHCRQPLRAHPGRPLVDMPSRTVSHAGQTIRLKPKLAEILDLLSRAYPRVVSHDQIMEVVWGESEPETAYKRICVYISQLRVVVAPLHIEIKAIYQSGYKLELEG